MVGWVPASAWRFCGNDGGGGFKGEGFLRGARLWGFQRQVVMELAKQADGSALLDDDQISGENQ